MKYIYKQDLADPCVALYRTPYGKWHFYHRFDTAKDAAHQVKALNDYSDADRLRAEAKRLREENSRLKEETSRPKTIHGEYGPAPAEFDGRKIINQVTVAVHTPGVAQQVFHLRREDSQDGNLGLVWGETSRANGIYRWGVGLCQYDDAITLAAAGLHAYLMSVLYSTVITSGDSTNSNPFPKL